MSNSNKKIENKLICTRCKDHIGLGAFYKLPKETICTSCYERDYKKTCAKCKELLGEEYMKAIGKDFHPKCFVCECCKSPFPHTTVEFITIRGIPYCKKCVTNDSYLKCERYLDSISSIPEHKRSENDNHHQTHGLEKFKTTDNPIHVERDYKNHPSMYFQQDARHLNDLQSL